MPTKKCCVGTDPSRENGRVSYQPVHSFFLDRAYFFLFGLIQRIKLNTCTITSQGLDSFIDMSIRCPHNAGDFHGLCKLCYV